MANVPQVKDETFKAEVLDAPVPVVVDFSAEWCGPCKKLAPIVGELAKEYQGKVKVLGLDIDEAQKTAMDFGILSVPSVVFFKGGKEVDRVVGLVPKQQLKDRIEKILK